MKIKNKDGSFRMSERGETDLRGSYIAVVISRILNIDSEELFGKITILQILMKEYIFNLL